MTDNRTLHRAVYGKLKAELIGLTGTSRWVVEEAGGEEVGQAHC